MKKKALLSSILTIVLCLSLITGSTFALFTSEDKVNIAVNAGTVEMTADLADIRTRSLDTPDGEWYTDGHFTAGGSASFTDGKLALDRIVPGDEISFRIVGTNKSNVNVKYRVKIACTDGTALMSGLVLTVNGTEYRSISRYTSAWAGLETGENMPAVAVSVKLPKEAGNAYQGLSAAISITVEAVQGNSDVTGGEEIILWDGTADTTWYDETKTEFTLSSEEQFAGLTALVAEGNTFEGKTIRLEGDLDLRAYDENGDPVSFTPIGSSKTVPFKGTFDGGGHTVENVYQSGWAFGYDWYHYGSVGLFGAIEDATVKNVTIKGAECFVEGGDVGGITGSAEGDCVFENITIADTDLATYNNGLGGIIGWSGEGTYTFKNITIDEDTVLGGLWGSFDSSIGGIVGQGEPGATYNFENVTIACRLDAYNDVTASYDYYNYRMSGMIIGRLAKTTTVNGVNYPDMTQYNITCTNVEVIYGDWANYHYCRPQGGRGIRVEPGYQYDGIAADYDHSTCTVHHMEVMPFDQLFGGDQYAVKGLPSYEGVEVTYEIGSARSLVEFGQLVNAGKSYGGTKVVLADDIDLAGIAWTPVNGFGGTFDGQGHTISNLTVTGESDVGFFKGLQSTAVVKDIVFDGAYVSGTHYVGVVVGWEGNEIANATIDGITVKNSTVVCDTDATGDNGDKAGGIAGYAVSLNITNCTVMDSSITAYRDFGGILGYANTSVYAAGNTVKNVTLTIDNDVNYKEYATDAEHDGNPIVGEAVDSAKLENNTIN